MNNIQWVIQKNLVSRGEIENFIYALQTTKSNWVPISFIPFSNKIEYESLASIDKDKYKIAIGSVNFIQEVYKNKKNWVPGVFYNPDTFNYRVWGKKYGDLLLNGDYRITNVSELREYWGDDDELFIRPLHDTKEFNGSIFDREEFISFTDTNIEEPNLEVVVAMPRHLRKEWRFVVVDGKIVSGTLYRKNHRLCTEPDYYGDAAKCAQEAIDIYKPADVFVIDIGRIVQGAYKVIEVGCFNAAGLYACYIPSIIKAISKYMEKKYDI